MACTEPLQVLAPTCSALCQGMEVQAIGAESGANAETKQVPSAPLTSELGRLPDRSVIAVDRLTIPQTNQVEESAGWKLSKST
ncbi:hypothetical protein L226DRAFT_538818 [Lentinus tigrinus ALCF2SS1-7]|nr:hypothetical protein L226DRAFT_538818 [Lentinus tigrinus ALCF2SS1-7]